MIRYSLPDFTVHHPVNMLLLNMKRQLPEFFFDDIEIRSAYGVFPGCIMNGGRIIGGQRYTREQIERTFEAYEKEGMILRITCTNMFIKPEQFEDEYSNIILREAQKRNGEVIVWSDALADYIRDRYHLRCILSTTRALKNVEELNEMLGRYDMVVLDYNRNKDDEFLKQVSDTTRLEVMPNEMCMGGCPFRQEHYEHESLAQLEGRNNELFGCRWKREGPGFTKRFDTSPVMLSNAGVRRMNQEYGITDFKIVGRINSIGTNLESYLYYLVRPQYRSAVCKMLVNELNRL